MSFLTPLYLLGAAAIIGPIIFHLVRKATQRRVPFSSLMFLRRSPPHMQARRRIDHWLLLLLRCAAVFLLATAFARPFFPQAAADERPVRRGDRVVVLIDSSASMRREDLWNQAVAQAKRALDALNVADDAAIVSFDLKPRMLMNFTAWREFPADQRSAAAAATISGMQPSWAATDLGAALTVAATMLEDALLDDGEGRTPQSQTIVLISDMQEGAAVDALQIYEWPESVTVDLRLVRPLKTTNAGIAVVSDRSGVAADGRPRVRVTNADDSQRERFQLAWTDADGRPLTDDAVEVYVVPGHSRAVTAPQVTAGVVSSRLVLLGDDHDFDNSAFIAEAPSDEVRVLYLGDDPPDDATQPLYFFQRALQPTPAYVPKLSVRSAAELSDDFDLSAFHLVVFTDVLPEAAAGRLREYTQGGGAVLMMMRSIEIVAAARTLLDAPLLRATEVEPSDYAMIAYAETSHPLLAAFSDPRFGDFTKIRCWRYRAIDLGTIAGAEALLRFDDQAVALGHVPIGDGHVVFTTFGWQPDESQFALSSKFVPLIHSLLEFIGAVKRRERQLVVGDAIAAPAARRGETIDVHITDPAGLQHEITPQRAFVGTERPGVYRLSAGERSADLAVNLDINESRTAPMTFDALEQFGVRPVTAAALTNEAGEQKRRERLRAREQEDEQKIWRWLIGGALAVLLVETLVGGLADRSARAAHHGDES